MRKLATPLILLGFLAGCGSSSHAVTFAQANAICQQADAQYSNPPNYFAPHISGQKVTCAAPDDPGNGPQYQVLAGGQPKLLVGP